MTNKPPTESFKNWAKGSGFPFENEVLREITQVKSPGGAFIQDIEFVAETPEGGRNIRSLDIRFDFFIRCQIDQESSDPEQGLRVVFLIDAKWHHQNEAYWFAPCAPGRQPVKLPSLIPTEKVSVVGKETISREDLNSLIQETLAHIPKAGRGSKVSEKEEKRQSLHSSVGQVLECLIHEAKQNSSALGFVKESKFHCVDGLIFVPILVTNAPLYMLKNGVTTTTIDSAKDILDVCTEEKIIAYEMIRNFHLARQIQKFKIHALNIAPEQEDLARWKVKNFERPYTFIVRKDEVLSFIESILAGIAKLPKSERTLPPFMYP